MPKASPTATPSISLKKPYSLKVKSGYPWIYADWIASFSVIATCKSGEIIHVYDHRGNFLASGLTEPNSVIAIRTFSPRKITRLDEAFFESALRECLAKRAALYQAPYYRWVNSEGDNLPGLVIDRFDRLISIHITTHCMHEYSDFILAAINSIMAPSGIIMRIMPKNETVEIGNISHNCNVFENSVNYIVNLVNGQKTGWYFDQRDNRRLVAGYANGKTVLDAFCYNGGFGIYCAKEGAKEVTFVDSSQAAINMVKASATLNKLNAKSKFITGDVFECLSGFIADKASFDLIILDPPPFIKNKLHKAAGIKGYYRLALLGLKLLNPQGQLFFSTCSHHMSKRDLLKQLNLAATKLGLRIRVITTTGHPADHPIHPHLPESHYLNSVLLERLS